MAFNGADSTDIAAFLTKYITPFAMGVLRKNMDILSDVPQIPRDLASINHKNKTVSVPIVGELVANTRAELGEVIDQVPSATDASGIYEEQESTFVFDDIAKAMLNPGNVNSYIDAAAKAVAKKLVTELYTVMGANAGTTIGNPANVLDYLDFIRPSRILDDNEFPDDARFFHLAPSIDQQVMNYDQYGYLFGTSGRKGLETTNNSVLNGFKMHKSPYLIGTTAKKNFAFQAAAMAQVFIPQEAGVHGGSIKSTFNDPSGISLSLNIQDVDKGNGSLRWTVSVRHAPIVVRPLGVVAIDALQDAP